MKPYLKLLLFGVGVLCIAAAGNIYYEVLPGLQIKHPITGATTATINGTNGTVTAGFFVGNGSGLTGLPSGGAIVGTLVTNGASATAGALVKFGTRLTNTVDAASADVQAALGQVYQGTNTVLTHYAGTDTNAILAAVGGVAKAGDTMTGQLQVPSLNLNANLTLYGDDANTLALRNGVNAQAFNIYNTYTDAANYETGFIGWNSGEFQVITGRAGTGTAKSLKIGTPSGGIIVFNSGASDRWQMSAGGHFLAIADNTYDIGVSGASRPRTVYVGTKVVTPEIDGGKTKVLTSTTAADFLYVSVPNTNAIGGRVEWEVISTDGTDIQSQSGSTRFDAVAKSTTVTAGLTTLTNAAVCSGGTTLTVGLASNVTTNNVFALGVTATTSLTTTNLLIKWRLETPSTFTVNSL